MRIFIDTNRCWNSGFETHFTNFLKNIDKNIGSDELIIYGHKDLIKTFQCYANNVNFIVDNSIPQNSLSAFSWRYNNLPKILDFYSPNVHLNLMGWMHHRKDNIFRVCMNRNLQPFIPETVNDLPVISKEFIRLKLYKKFILKSYNNSNIVIFNSEYAKDIIEPNLNNQVKSVVINHGVNESFFMQPRLQTKVDNVDLLFISDFYPYKNHENLIKAVYEIRVSKGLNLKLNLIGNMNNAAVKRMNNLLTKIDNSSKWLIFHNRVSQEQLINHFKSNDIFIYPSSVESFGHSLIEAMAAGLPVLSSNKRPMIDFLGTSAFTFDEVCIDNIKTSILEYINDPKTRYESAIDSYNRALNFSYEKSTLETLDILRSI